MRRRRGSRSSAAARVTAPARRPSEETGSSRGARTRPRPARAQPPPGDRSVQARPRPRAHPAGRSACAAWGARQASQAAGARTTEASSGEPYSGSRASPLAASQPLAAWCCGRAAPRTSRARAPRAAPRSTLGPEAPPPHAGRTRRARSQGVRRPGKLGYPHRLTSQRFGLLSQNGEDGVLLALIEQAGPGGRRFAEVGCGTNGGNSGFLARELGWSRRDDRRLGGEARRDPAPLQRAARPRSASFRDAREHRRPPARERDRRRPRRAQHRHRRQRHLGLGGSRPSLLGSPSSSTTPSSGRPGQLPCHTTPITCTSRGRRTTVRRSPR